MKKSFSLKSLTLSLVFFLIFGNLFFYKIFSSTKVKTTTYSFFKKIANEGCSTKRLYIRQATLEDVDILGEYFFDKDVSTLVCPHLYLTNGFKNIDKSKKYISKNICRKDVYVFVICLKENNQIIGEITFDCSKKKILWIAYWLGKNFHKKGYMSELVPLVKYVFDSCYYLKNLHIQCFHNNIGSYKICKKVCKLFENGEYDIKEHLALYNYRDDERTEVIMFDILKNK